MRNGETFEHCELRMCEMLATEGHTGRVVWTFCEDYIWDGNVLFVGMVDSVANSFAAKSVFDDNGKYPYGIEISLSAVADGSLYCALRAPSSMSDAQYELIDGIKLSVPFRLPACRTVVDSCEWSTMLAKRGSKGYAEYPFSKCMRKADLPKHYGPPPGYTRRS